MEEEYTVHKHLTFKNIILVILVLIFLNLVYLDVLFIRGGNVKTIERIITDPFSVKTNSGDYCSPDCVDTKISNAIAKLKITGSITPIATPIPTKTVVQTSNSSAPREYYIPFGSASQSSTDWANVSGLSASVDSTSYPNIKAVVFEVSLHVPTGNETASVRLYNITDGHPVWASQVDFLGSTQSVLKTSDPVTLDSGNKIYQVQILTQLDYPAVIDQSRLHITTK